MKKARGNGKSEELPGYVAVIGCGLDRVHFPLVPLGPVTHAVTEAARRLGHVDADHQPHFLLLAGGVGEAREMRRFLMTHGVTSDDRVLALGYAVPTLHGRAEALWGLLPHNSIPRGEQPLVLIVAPEPLLKLVELIFKSYAERRHHARLQVFRFRFQGVPVPYSKSAKSWQFRGERRFKFWRWWAEEYHKLWSWGFGEVAPKPRLS